MKTRLIYFLIVLSIILRANAQELPKVGAMEPEFFPGDYSFYSLSLTRDPFERKETLVTGAFQGQLYFDQDTLESNSVRSGFFGVKDSLSQWLWYKTIEGSGYNQINNALSLNDGWLITGVFSDTILLGNNQFVSTDYQNVFYAKVNFEGDFVFSKRLEIIPNGGRQFIKPGRDGHFFFATEFIGAFYFNDSLYSVKNQSVILGIINPEGEPARFANITSGPGLEVGAFETIQGNRLLLGVNFNDTLYANNQIITAKGSSDFMLAVFNSNLDIQWNRLTEGAGEKKLVGVTPHSGGFIAFGEYSGEFLLDSIGFDNQAGKHLFLVKMMVNGNEAWRKTILGASDKRFGGLIKNNENHLYIWANYRGVLNLGDWEFETEEFTYEWFLARFSPEGVPLWISLAGNEHNIMSGIAQDFEPGVFSVFGVNREPGLGFFNMPFENDGQEMFEMKLKDCDFAMGPKLPADTVFCGFGILDAGTGYAGYLWNNSISGQQFLVAESGLVTLEVIDQYGCVINDTIFVDVLPEFDIQITGNELICPFGGTTLLLVDANAEVFWSTGDTGNALLATEPGHYHAVAINQSGCRAEASMLVSYHEVLQPLINDYYSLSPGQVLEIYPGEYYSYLWSNGSTQPVFILDGNSMEQGSFIFSLQAADFNNCQVNHEFLVDVFVNTANSAGINEDGGALEVMFDLEDEPNENDCDFLVYPNPGRGPFFIIPQKHGLLEDIALKNLPIELVLFTETGRLVNREQLDTESFPWRIHISPSMGPGIYVVGLLVEKNICRFRKIIISH